MQAISHSGLCTRIFSVLAWGRNWILSMHGWFCSIRLIHLIGRKSLYFENKTTVSDTGYPRRERAVNNWGIACSPVAIKYFLGQAIFLLDLFSPNFERLVVISILADPAWFCEAFSVGWYGRLQGNYTGYDPLGYFTQTHTKMISPDKSLHPVKLNNLLQVNKHNK